MTDGPAARDALAQLHQAVQAAHEGRRPPLTPEELVEYARVIRPDAETRIEIVDGPDGPMIVMRAIVVVRPPAGPPLDALTRREQEVARYVAQGLTNPQIARALGISFSTVKDHVHNILRQLGLQSRQELVAVVVRAMERRLAEPAPASTTE
jgi:DNA-binding NarL/FixJ family response regulator